MDAYKIVKLSPYAIISVSNILTNSTGTRSSKKQSVVSSKLIKYGDVVMVTVEK